MKRSKFQYILTWVSLLVMMTCSTLLVAYAWNSKITAPISPSLMMLLWIGITASGIFLFMLAVKKAHRLWIDEERHLEKMQQDQESAVISLDELTVDFPRTEVSAKAFFN